MDTLWLGDGLFRRPDFAGWRGGLESLTELAWLAGRHDGIRIGITAAVLPVRDMVWLAREVATLDQLTEGRFVLAVCAGFWADELAYRGIEPDARGREFRARRRSCADCWPVTSSPPPRSRPAGHRRGWPAARPRCAWPPGWGCRSRPPVPRPPSSRRTADAWRAAGSGTLAHRIYLEAGGTAPDGQQVERHVVEGDADQLLTALRAYRDLGVEDLSLVIGHDDTSARRTLDVLAADVLPRLAG